MHFHPLLRLLLTFNMANTNGNANANSSTSVWPTIELPKDSAIHYCDAKNNDKKTIRSVTSSMNYCASHVTDVHVRRDLGGTDSELVGASWLPCKINIQNGRLSKKPPTLDKSGFQLVSSPLAPDHTINFKDSDSVIDNYYPICEKLVQKMTGCATVHAFDHNVRVSGSELRDQQGNTVLQQPIGVVHNDYTHVSAPRRLEQLGQPPKANDSLQKRLQGKPLLDPQVVQEALTGERRFVFLNVWRNIQKDAPIQQFPLACVDATTQSIDDLLTFQIIYKDRIGENYFTRFNAQQEWNYFPQMDHHEAILLKQWDNQGTLALRRKEVNEDNFLSTFALHSAFQDPSSPDNAPPRESIEVRCVLIWDKQ